MRLDTYEKCVLELGLTAAVIAAQDAFDVIDRSAGTVSVRTSEGRLMATIVLCGRWLEEIDRAPALITGGIELPGHLRRELGAATVFSMAAAADWPERFRDEPALLVTISEALDRLKSRAFPSWDRQAPSSPAV